MAETIQATDTTFDSEVIRSDVPVLVDFWAEWCGPCKMLSPVLEQISDDYAGKVKVVKVNVDENQELAAKFGIRSIPTMIMFKGGEAVASKMGAVPKQALSQFVAQHA